MTPNRTTRRQFIGTGAAAGILAAARTADDSRSGEVGIATSSVDAHLAPPSAN